MSLKTLEDVLFHGLKDLLSAEKQFRDALPKLAEAAKDNDLKNAFSSHLNETKIHIDRIEECFKLLDRAERSEKCEAAAGICKEGEHAIEAEGEAPAKDVLLTAAGRKAEHYEIASYTDAAAWARQLGKADIADLLSKTLKEEKHAAEKLQSIGDRLATAS